MSDVRFIGAKGWAETFANYKVKGKYLSLFSGSVLGLAWEVCFRYHGELRVVGHSHVTAFPWTVLIPPYFLEQDEVTNSFTNALYSVVSSKVANVLIFPPSHIALDVLYKRPPKYKQIMRKPPTIQST